MIDIFIEGHKYKHDLFELIRVFFPEKELRFVREIKDKSFLIKSILREEGDNRYTTTRVYIGDRLIIEGREDICNIKVKTYGTDRLIKIAIKKSIYKSLIEISDKSVPWGILTGIRPLKVVHNLIDYRLKEDKIFNLLNKDYKIDKDKVKTMLDIAKIQRKYIYPVNRDRYSLYIGIPFCPTRCSYCSFPAFGLARDYKIVEKYIDTLLYEIEATSNLMKGKKLNTIYIGGGTPSSIKTKDLERIIQAIRYNFPEDIKEFTVEAGRPDTISRDMLKMLSFHGVDRISINPQTMNQKTLNRISREHSVESIFSTYSLAKDVGFDIINMDIILGLPGENKAHVKYTLNEIKKLDPENLTIHTLALKRGSKLLRKKDRRLEEQEKNIQDMFYEVEKLTENNNYRPYYLYRQKRSLGNLENIGYSKDNMESIYNIAMMEERETIIGLGLGAVSKIYNHKDKSIKRVANFKGLKDYNERIRELIIRKKEGLINNKFIIY